MAHEHQELQHTAHAAEHAHPGPREYITIAVILACITAVEVAIYYVKDPMGAAFIPVLLVLSATKFAMVVMWFMHLKFDSRLFSSIFVGGLLLAAAVLIALIFLFSTPHLTTAVID